MSVYSLPVSEVVSAGPGRVIVETGAETRVNQVSSPFFISASHPTLCSGECARGLT